MMKGAEVSKTVRLPSCSLPYSGIMPRYVP